jgi:hypothetical protein
MIYQRHVPRFFVFPKIQNQPNMHMKKAKNMLKGSEDLAD